MSDNEEIITELEWYRRALQAETKIYDIIFIDWKGGLTRVMDKHTGEIFDVTAKRIGGKIMLSVKKLD